MLGKTAVPAISMLVCATFVFSGCDSTENESVMQALSDEPEQSVPDVQKNDFLNVLGLTCVDTKESAIGVLGAPVEVAVGDPSDGEVEWFHEKAVMLGIDPDTQRITTISVGAYEDNDKYRELAALDSKIGLLGKKRHDIASVLGPPDIEGDRGPYYTFTGSSCAGVVQFWCHDLGARVRGDNCLMFYINWVYHGDR